MLALLGILNSKLASRIIMLLGQKSQRKLFPKIVKDDLQNFLLPATWIEASKALAVLVERRLSDARVEDELERMVQSLYGFSADALC